MSGRLLAAALAVLATTGCASVERAAATLSPDVFYGFASRVREDGALCLLDERDGDPGRERCFVVDQQAAEGEDLQQFDLVKITYEEGEGEGDVARAVSVREIER